MAVDWGGGGEELEGGKGGKKAKALGSGEEMRRRRTGAVVALPLLDSCRVRSRRVSSWRARGVWKQVGVSNCVGWWP